MRMTRMSCWLFFANDPFGSRDVRGYINGYMLLHLLHINVESCQVRFVLIWYCCRFAVVLFEVCKRYCGKKTRLSSVNFLIANGEGKKRKVLVNIYISEMDISWELSLIRRYFSCNSLRFWCMPLQVYWYDSWCVSTRYQIQNTKLPRMRNNSPNMSLKVCSLHFRAKGFPLSN
jgi:hypothetical protein